MTAQPVATALCSNCKGEGWVCENHPDKAWSDGEGCCGGAGSPCKCNESDSREKPPWHFMDMRVEDEH